MVFLTVLAGLLVIFFVKQPNFTEKVSIEGNIFVTNTTAKDKPKIIVVSEYDPGIKYRIPYGAFIKSVSIEWFNDGVGNYNVSFTYTTPTDVILYSLEDCEAYELIKIDKNLKIRQDISLTLKTNCENTRAPEASNDISKETWIVGYQLINGISDLENKNFTSEEIQDIRRDLQNSKSYQRDAEYAQLPDDKLKKYLVAHWFYTSAEYKYNLYDLGNCIKNQMKSYQSMTFYFSTFLIMSIGRL